MLLIYTDGDIMKEFIDADGCPVVDIAVRIAKKYGVECTIICDTSHSIQRESAKTITGHL